MNLEKMIKESHELAMEKGWWDLQGECGLDPSSSRVCERGTKSCVIKHLRSELEILALMHSEIAEATECVRKGEEPFYLKRNSCYMCADTNVECIMCASELHKPEGEAVELVDLCIRIFDWLGKHGTKLRPLNKIAISIVGIEFHGYLHNYFDLRYCSDALALMVNYFERMGWDFEEIYKAKYEYNKTRPYRHGGKTA